MLLKTTPLLLCILNVCLAGDIIEDLEEGECKVYSSCASCLTSESCTWCVTKSRCTRQACGNDNVIYPSGVPALMSGPDFCPRVDGSKPFILKSGRKRILEVVITQIYLYMAFTPWKCKISLNGKEDIVPAVLIANKVYCESMAFVNDSEEPYMQGSVAVMWNYNKAFDGSVPIKVCRCDLTLDCTACRNK